MESLDNIFAILVLIAIPLLLVALLVTALLPRNKRNEFLRMLRRLQF